MKQNLKTKLDQAQKVCETLKKVDVFDKHAISTGIYKLKQLIVAMDHQLHDYDFGDKEVEIDFFKNHLTCILSDYLYYKEVFLIEVGRPMTSDGYRKYYTSVMNSYNQFKVDYIDRYLYFCTSEPLDDEALFTRENQQLTVHLNHLSCDYIPDQTLARSYFLAIDRLTPFIEENLKLKNTIEVLRTNLRWTGSDVEAVELIYMLKHSGLINDGEIGINKLALHFDHFLKTKVSDHIYRTFNDVKNRKHNNSMVLNKFAKAFKDITTS